MPHTINGKPVTKTEEKFLSQLDIRPDDFKEVITNPMSGESIECNNLQEAIYSFIMGAQQMPWWNFQPPAQGWTKHQKEVIRYFSIGLDMFRKYYCKHYMILLD